MICAEAFAEALCLFQYPSQLGPPDSIIKHCLLMSVTQAHTMPVAWPHTASHIAAKQVVKPPWPCVAPLHIGVVHMNIPHMYLQELCLETPTRLPRHSLVLQCTKFGAEEAGRLCGTAGVSNDAVSTHQRISNQCCQPGSNNTGAYRRQEWLLFPLIWQQPCAAQESV